MGTSDDIEYLADRAPPPAGPPIAEVHIWIATYADGTEDMLVGDFDIAVGDGRRIRRQMPLMSASRPRAHNLAEAASRARRMAVDHCGRPVRMELRTFRAVP